MSSNWLPAKEAKLSRSSRANCQVIALSALLVIATYLLASKLPQSPEKHPSALIIARGIAGSESGFESYILKGFGFMINIGRIVHRARRGA